METIYKTIALVTVECCNCHMTFGMPEQLKQRLLDSHKDFYCPAGHNQHYVGETELARTKRQLEETRKYNGDLQNRIEEKTKAIIVQKGLVTRYRNARDKIKVRVDNGVCPCCNRTFQNLARHMKTKHSDQL